MDIAVIGGGAAGMAAAVTAARGGAAVCIIEHNNRIGKKILVTGNGKCNYTNAVQKPSCYRGDDPSFAKGALSQFTLQDTLSFFEELGIVPIEKNGYYYPASQTAAAVLDVLRMELKHLGVKIVTDTHATAVRKEKNGFAIETAKETFHAGKIILAAGGRAAKIHGSDGSGYIIAKKLGHTVTETVPALTALSLEGNYTRSWKGVRVQGRIRLYTGGKRNSVLAEERGELQLVDYGISGIPVFQISRYAAKALHNQEEVFLAVDFMPDMTREECRQLFYRRRQQKPYKTLEEQMIGIFHKQLAGVLVKRAHLPAVMPSGELADKQIMQLVEVIKNMQARVTAVNGFDKAQVTAGGIRTEEINAYTMESRIVKGLYFAGEIIDIDGTCGGYNLQWAWSSGVVAGRCCMGGESKDNV